VIYLPLVMVFICARALLPNQDKPDEVMPRMALLVANPLVAGIILAAPFGAVMATVSGFLVQISSAFVSDVYHRLRPDASEGTLRRLSQAAIIGAALISSVGAIFSPKFLQAIIVFTGGAAACAYLFPAIMAAFWKRGTARGALASMLGGVGTVLLLYAVGWIMAATNPGWEPGIGEKSTFSPIYPLGVAPFVWGLAMSVVLGITVSLAEKAPQSELLERYFPAS
jgi:SSS family solute:Na+ symporter/sodium/pantothenate symporter